MAFLCGMEKIMLSSAKILNFQSISAKSESFVFNAAICRCRNASVMLDYTVYTHYFFVQLMQAFLDLANKLKNRAEKNYFLTAVVVLN